MGVDEPEVFRCRIYGAEEDKRVDLIKRMASSGVLDCPAYDGATAALACAGWAEMQLEPNHGPEGGKVGRWRLTAAGETEMRRLGVL